MKKTFLLIILGSAVSVFADQYQSDHRYGNDSGRCPGGQGGYYQDRPNDGYDYRQRGGYETQQDSRNLPYDQSQQYQQQDTRYRGQQYYQQGTRPYDPNQPYSQQQYREQQHYQQGTQPYDPNRPHQQRPTQPADRETK